MKERKSEVHAMYVGTGNPEQACRMVVDTCITIAKKENLSVELILLHSISKQLLKAKVKHGGFKQTARMSFNWHAGECPTMAILHGAICLYLDEHQIDAHLEWGAI